MEGIRGEESSKGPRCEDEWRRIERRFEPTRSEGSHCSRIERRIGIERRMDESHCKKADHDEIEGYCTEEDEGFKGTRQFGIEWPYLVGIFGDEEECDEEPR